MAAKKIYQVQIVLNGAKPKIWRRLLINPDTLLVDFHRIIQTAMGWTNSHLHLFSDGIVEYAPKEFEVEDTYDSRKVKLSKILKGEGAKIRYEYDFGDSWEHTILIEKIIPAEDGVQIPQCIAGKRNCPPEDVGGIWGYEDMLKILKNPDHEEYESYVEWLGEVHDPEYFDMDKINENLRQKDFGCIWL